MLVVPQGHDVRLVVHVGVAGAACRDEASGQVPDVHVHEVHVVLGGLLAGCGGVVHGHGRGGVDCGHGYIYNYIITIIGDYGNLGGFVEVNEGGMDREGLR